MTLIKKILTVQLFFFSVFCFAIPASLSRKRIFDLVENRLADNGDSQKFIEGRKYYHFKFQTDQPRTDSSKKNSEPWKSEEIMYFANDKSEVTQIALIAKICGAGKGAEVQRSIQKQIRTLASRETNTLFGAPLKLKDGDFKEVGPDIDKWARVLVDHNLKDVRKVRLGRGLYKCDGRTGFGYRLDFFLT